MTAAALAWKTLPASARTYVALVIAGGLLAIAAFFPHDAPDPWLFAFVLVAACVTSAWKLNLPMPLASGATLSVSYAADMMALLLLGPRVAVVIAAVGVWIQCTVRVKQPYPLYRTVFSTAAEAVTMAAAGATYVWLGGTLRPIDLPAITGPVVGAIAAYFFVNTGLVATAIALSTRRGAWRVWRDEFAWSAASFLVAGSAGALAAIVIQRGWRWESVLLLAPVYLTYRTYRLFVDRLGEQKRHLEETERLHRAALEALEAARTAERALAGEKAALAAALDETHRLERARIELLQREQAARASAESANRLKDQFLATVSHELRTPLNAILGWAEMLKTGALPDEKRDRAHDAIMNNAKRQASLIEELLDVARIMSGKLRIDRSIVDAREVVTAALETVQPVAEAKGVRVSVEIDPRVRTLRGDGPRLQQVLWNLLSNAVKFTPSGGSVAIRMRRRGSVGEIVVADTGCGIPRDFLPSVFEPFRQADGSPTRVHGGLGLGLAIVRHLVEAHGGTVSVDSPGEGRGSTFTVRLPLPVELIRQPASASQDDRAAIGRDALTGVRVMVVDDDEDSRRVAAARLESHGAIVLTAGSAAEALRLLQRDQVDVLLADIAMPEEDGYSLLRKVRSMCPPPTSLIPAAALTAFARDEDREEALRAGFQAHLAKPVETAALVSAVALLARASTT